MILTSALICILPEFFVSTHPFLSLFRLIKYTEVILLAILFKTLIGKRYVHYAFFLGALTQLMLVILQLIIGHPIGGVWYMLGERYFASNQPGIAKAALFGIQFIRPYGTFSHPNSMGGFYLGAYVLFLWFYDKKQVSSLLFYLGGLIFSLLIFLSFSKTAIVSYGIITIVFTFFSEKLSCRLCTISRIVVLLTVTGVFLTASGDPLSLHKRIVLLGHWVELFRYHVLLGVGMGHYLFYSSAHTQSYPYLFIQPVHNTFLLLLAEIGILRGAYVGYYFLKRAGRKLFKLPYLFLLIAVVLTGNIDHYWITLQQNLLLLGIIGAVIVQESSKQPSS